jgi:hypothetical protein
VYLKKATQATYNSYYAGTGDHFTFPNPLLGPNTAYNVFVRTVACNGSVSANSQVHNITTGGPGCRLDDETVVTTADVPAALTVYPNPSAGPFSVDVPGTLTGGQVRLEVVNALGQVVLTHYATETTAGIPELIGVQMPSDAASGAYLVRVQAGNQTLNARVVVQK